jgi:uncharacterized membrane protein
VDLLELCRWIQSTGPATALRQSWYVYPFVLTGHLAGMGLFGAMIAATNLRLLALAMTKRPVADVIDQLRTLKRIGLVIVATCGILLFSAKAEEYYLNIFFRWKLALFALLILHALAFRKSVYANPAQLDQAPAIPATARLAAVLSLILWLSVLCMGRGIGYIQPPFGIQAISVDQVNPR